MRLVLRPALLAVVGAAAFTLAACNQGGSKISPDEQAIRDLDAQWVNVINNKDANGAAAMYAEDGGIYAPNAPPAVGHEAVLATWITLLQTPGFALSFQPSKITIAASKDLAIDVGTYTLRTGDVNAPKVENGKYVVTWMRRDNVWKVYTDMFSSDTAPPPASPTAESVAPMPPSATSPTPSLAPMGADNAMPGATTPALEGAAPADSPAGTQPGSASPSLAGGQTTPPVQQFGPASPMQNAAPLMPNGAGANPTASPAKQLTSPSSAPSTAPSAPAQ